MAVSRRDLPDTMVCPETGTALSRDVRPFVVSYEDKSISVELPGYYPNNGACGVHIGDDMEIVDAAMRSLKQAGDGD